MANFLMQQSWGDSFRKRDCRRLEKLIERAGSTIGVGLETLVEDVEQQTHRTDATVY